MAYRLLASFILAVSALGSVSAWARSPKADCVYRKSTPQASAKKAGLNYVEPGEGPGISREIQGKGKSRKTTYRLPSGKKINDATTLERIRELQIPPGWKNVWISADSKAHVQAIGFDDAGEMQYRYHPKWKQVRADEKFVRILKFGERMPAIRKRLESDLKDESTPLSRKRMLAVLVRTMESSSIRVGNEEFALKNGTYGLTTLLDRHVTIKGSKLKFGFKGKSDVWHDVELDDPKLARFTKLSRALPGKRLFQFLDEQGDVHPLSSDDLNDYLKEISGGDFSAKDFRTWNGTVAAARKLLELGPYDTVSKMKRNVVSAVEAAAASLRNEPAVARKAYVHPGLLKAYEQGEPFFKVVRKTESSAAARDPQGPPLEELFVLRLFSE